MSDIADGPPECRMPAPRGTGTRDTRHGDASEHSAENAGDPRSAPVSQQVSFWSVHTFVQRYLDAAGDYPMCGSPAWCLLPDDNREKWAALLDFAQHHALRVEHAQEVRADASRAVCDAEDWASVSREIQQRSAFRKAKPWAKRVTR